MRYLINANGKYVVVEATFDSPKINVVEADNPTVFPTQEGARQYSIELAKAFIDQVLMKDQPKCE